MLSRAKVEHDRQIHEDYRVRNYVDFVGRRLDKAIGTLTEQNGLRVVSEIEIDWIYTVPKESVDGVIGTLELHMATQVDTALRRWLDL